MEEKVLLFQIPEGELLSRIKLTLSLVQVEAKLIKSEDFGKTIGALAGIPTAPNQTVMFAPVLPEPMMVLCMPQSKLDAVLAALRNASVPPIAKAMLTPTNAGWTPGQLLTELQREREEFRKMRKN